MVPGPARQPTLWAQRLGNNSLGMRMAELLWPQTPTCTPIHPTSQLPVPTLHPPSLLKVGRGQLQGVVGLCTLPRPLTSPHLGSGRGSWSPYSPTPRPRAPRGGWSGAVGSCWPGAALQRKSQQLGDKPGWAF